jgi:hypothetical protein
MTTQEADERIAALERRYHEYHLQRATMKQALVRARSRGAEREADELRAALVETERQQHVIICEVEAIEDALLEQG